MNTPALAAIIEISIDTENDTYKTKSYIEVAEEYADEKIELPRDVLLGMIYELSEMASKLADKADASIEEIDDYLAARKLVGDDTTDDSAIPSSKKKSKGKKDAIDYSIDNLFAEDEDPTNM